MRRGRGAPVHRRPRLGERGRTGSGCRRLRHRRVRPGRPKLGVRAGVGRDAAQRYRGARRGGARGGVFPTAKPEGVGVLRQPLRRRRRARAGARARRARPVPETRGTGHRGVRRRGLGVRCDRGGDRRPRAFAGASPGPQRVRRDRGFRVARVHAAHRGDVAAPKSNQKRSKHGRRRSKSLAARKPARPGRHRRARPRARGAHRRARGRTEARRRSRVRARARSRARRGDDGGGGALRRRRRAPGA